MSPTTSSSSTSASSSSVESAPNLPLRNITIPTFQLPYNTFRTYSLALLLYHDSSLNDFFPLLTTTFRSTAPHTHVQDGYMLQILRLSRYFQSRDLTYPSPTALSSGLSNRQMTPPVSSLSACFLTQGPITAVMTTPTIITFILTHSGSRTTSHSIEIRTIMTYFMLLSICEFETIPRPSKAMSERNVLTFCVSNLISIFTSFLPFPAGYFTTVSSSPQSFLHLLHDQEISPSFRLAHTSMFSLPLEALFSYSPYRHILRLIFEPYEASIRNWVLAFHMYQHKNILIANCDIYIHYVLPTSNEIEHILPPGSIRDFFLNLIQLPYELQTTCYDYMMFNIMHRCDFHQCDDTSSFTSLLSAPIIIPTLWTTLPSHCGTNRRRLSFSTITDVSSSFAPTALHNHLSSGCRSPTIGSMSHVPAFDNARILFSRTAYHDHCPGMSAIYNEMKLPHGIPCITVEHATKNIYPCFKRQRY